MARAGVSFQSHTCDHLDLTTVGAPERRLQLERAKADLEILLGSPVSYLAYPYGRFNEEVEQMVGELGYAGAFSVLPGFNRPGTGRYRLRRLDVLGTDTPDQLLRKLALGTNDGSGRAIARYVVKRALQRMTVWK
jgi:peptidoglycan/xylan/chitin deacetylase (PgdA/CDA1 family)